MSSIKRYFVESLQELRNVTWPTQAQAIRITTVVFIFMIIAALVLGVIDQGFTKLYQLLLSTIK